MPRFRPHESPLTPTLPPTRDALQEHLVASILSGGMSDLEVDMPAAPNPFRLDVVTKLANVRKRDRLRAAVPEPPAPGEAVHVISCADFDFWTWVPEMIASLGTADHLYCSTWTLSRQNVAELVEVMDTGKITGQVSYLTGTYFKRRETATYSLLLEALLARGHRFRAFENHCKILLLANAQKGAWLTVEGSANLNSNPRLEQYVITNHRGLHDWHRAWMDAIWTSGKRAQ
ncbi:MAG TPA: hypothetical protein VNE39_14140 [Planctomycetota bacterium]|nr:hypothetical protein [Planctomycetota bacterium]